MCQSVARPTHAAQFLVDPSETVAKVAPLARVGPIPAGALPFEIT